MNSFEFRALIAVYGPTHGVFAMVVADKHGVAETGGLTIDEIRAGRARDVALGYRLFAAYGWGDLGDGHISARDPERPDCFWLLRAGVSFQNAAVSDLVLVGPDGAIMIGEGPINISAYHIHRPIRPATPKRICSESITRDSVFARW